MKDNKSLNLMANVQFEKPGLSPGEVLSTIDQILRKHTEKAAEEVRNLISGPEIERALTEGDSEQRDSLCSMLGELRMNEYTKLLIELLDKDPSACVRHEAAFALGHFGTPEVVEALKEAALNDRSVLVRHEATLALARFPGVQETLEHALNDPSPDVRESAEVALTPSKR
jgi:HEAT repeat protein